MVGKLANNTTPWLKQWLIQRFIHQYRVDMSEAAADSIEAYPHFNAFFTRALKADARQIAAGSNDIASPADGAISEIGPIKGNFVTQAKGHLYTLDALLANDNDSITAFRGGHFATIYLSPKDYHRVHMPIDGTLTKTIYVPGKLFSVNQATADGVPDLFARNERLVCLFDTAAGPMAMILVGAMIVAAIETVWGGQVTPLSKNAQTQHYTQSVTLKKGEEMGRFQLGSTVILLFGQQAIEWQHALSAGQALQMGQAIGQVIR